MSVICRDVGVLSLGFKCRFVSYVNRKMESRPETTGHTTLSTDLMTESRVHRLIGSNRLRLVGSLFFLSLFLSFFLSLSCRSTTTPPSIRDTEGRVQLTKATATCQISRASLMAPFYCGCPVWPRC